MYQGSLSSVALTVLACLPSLPLPFVPFPLSSSFLPPSLSPLEFQETYRLTLAILDYPNFIVSAGNCSEHHGFFSAHSLNRDTSPDYRLLWPCFTILAITNMPDLQSNGSSKAAPLLRRSGTFKDLASKRYGTLTKVSVIEREEVLSRGFIISLTAFYNSRNRGKFGCDQCFRLRPQSKFGKIHPPPFCLPYNSYCCFDCEKRS